VTATADCVKSSAAVEPVIVPALVMPPVMAFVPITWIPMPVFPVAVIVPLLMMAAAVLLPVIVLFEARMPTALPWGALAVIVPLLLMPAELFPPMTTLVELTSIPNELVIGDVTIIMPLLLTPAALPPMILLLAKGLIPTLLARLLGLVTMIVPILATPPLMVLLIIAMAVVDMLLLIVPLLVTPPVVTVDLEIDIFVIAEPAGLICAGAFGLPLTMIGGAAFAGPPRRSAVTQVEARSAAARPTRGARSERSEMAGSVSMSEGPLVVSRGPRSRGITARI